VLFVIFNQCYLYKVPFKVVVIAS